MAKVKKIKTKKRSIRTHHKNDVPRYYGVDVHHIALGVAVVGTLVLVMILRVS